MERPAKQVIVMRRKFIIDGETKTVRTGKMIAQGAHASMAALLNIMERTITSANGLRLHLDVARDTHVYEWLQGRFTKVVVYVDTLEELEAIYAKAKKSDLICSIITDAGFTEFKGQPQKTCCAIGPAWEDEVNEITGKLPLL